MVITGTSTTLLQRYPRFSGQQDINTTLLRVIYTSPDKQNIHTALLQRHLHFSEQTKH